MKFIKPIAILIFFIFLPHNFLYSQSVKIQVGSKKFTESVILGEIIKHLVMDTGASVTHRQELGGTRILWNALLRGSIDIYPEYTGTISQEILAGKELKNEEEIRLALIEQGIRMSKSLGFNNTYALGMKEQIASERNIQKISDLKNHLDLKFGFTNEFMDREDGWPSLQLRYQLQHQDVRGLDHDLAYRALDSESIHVTDLYSTDADIKYYNLRILQDDLHLFPIYNAVLLYHDDLSEKAPEVIDAILKLEGKISEPEMVRMNAKAKLERIAEQQIAVDFLKKTYGLQIDTQIQTRWDQFWQNTKSHILLVLLALTVAILISIPLGIYSARHRKLGQFILGNVGIIQTIPALALLVFMIPILAAIRKDLGIGAAPTIAASVLYGLLPIVRNTYTGLKDIPLHINESAIALGLPSRSRLWLVELHMASRAILAGVKTSAVMIVGFVTLGALIGAPGYGQPILTGIRLADTGLILQGALPAAILSLIVQGLFELAERWLVPKGLRIESTVK